MTADVYMVKPGGSQETNLIEGTRKLYNKLDLPFENKTVAVKLHFGEAGNSSFLRPIYAGVVVEEMKRAGARPFLTDSNTLYRGSRSNAVDHIETAMRHGFIPPVVNAPVIIADGLTGQEQVSVPFEGGKHLKRALLGSAAVKAHGMIGLTHFKGHEMTGFGGALKNIGMGIGSRAGKEMMHGDTKLQVNPEVCVACGACIPDCPTEAIKMHGDHAHINQEVCIGCGACLSVCPERAIKGGRSLWDSSFAEIQEKIAEYCWAYMQDRKERCGFLNFVMDITPRCDCPAWSEAPIARSIGIFASKDPVALDQACVDAVIQQEGRDPFKDHNGIDWSIQLEHAERLGVGDRRYKLKEI